MSITNFVKKLCVSLGNNNKSTYSVVAISMANGICRPTFTMRKKGEDPQAKRYAALREGLTELVAIPTYLVTGELAAKCGEKIAKKAVDTEIKHIEQYTELTDKTKQIFKDSKIKDSKSSLMLLGVCFAAGVIIPALCSTVMNPLMSTLKKQRKSSNLETLDLSSEYDVQQNNLQNFENALKVNNPFNNNYRMSSGMNVGRI